MSWYKKIVIQCAFKITSLFGVVLLSNTHKSIHGARRLLPCNLRFDNNTTPNIEYRVKNRIKFFSGYVILGFIGLISIACISCMSAKEFTPKQYMLEVSLPHKLNNKASSKVLEINSINVVPQFASLGFVYRVSDLNYVVDYYNVFFTPPAQQINKIMNNYMRAKNIFSYISSGNGQLKSDYILYPEITALYADYRDSKRPLAVMVTDVTLFSKEDVNKPLLHKSYTARISLVEKSSESLVKSWNKALQSILADISRDLSRAI